MNMIWSMYVKLNDAYRYWRLRWLKKIGKEPSHTSLVIHDINQGQKEGDK